MLRKLGWDRVSRDVQLSPRTVSSYYSILQDTLIGHLLPPFRERKTRKAVATPKFYYFDVGVCNFLTGRDKISKGTTEYGKALEHFIFTELIAFRDYSEKPFGLYYWRSTSQFEVDFVIRSRARKLIAIEVKGTSKIDKDDLKGIRALEDDFDLAKKIIVCNERNERNLEGGYQVLPFKLFCERLWEGKII